MDNVANDTRTTQEVLEDKGKITFINPENHPGGYKDGDPLVTDEPVN